MFENKLFVIWIFFCESSQSFALQYMKMGGRFSHPEWNSGFLGAVAAEFCCVCTHSSGLCQHVSWQRSGSWRRQERSPTCQNPESSMVQPGTRPVPGSRSPSLQPRSCLQQEIISVFSFRFCHFVCFLSGYLACDPWDDEDFHPGERGGGGAVEKLWVQLHLRSPGLLVVSHVGQQGGSCKAVCGVQDEKSQKNSERGSVGHKLHEGTPHHFSNLRK